MTWSDGAKGPPAQAPPAPVEATLDAEETLLDETVVVLLLEGGAPPVEPELEALEVLAALDEEEVLLDETTVEGPLDAAAPPVPLTPGAVSIALRAPQDHPRLAMKSQAAQRFLNIVGL